MLTCVKKNRFQKRKLESDLKKLIERVDLDRPIMQREKYTLIMLEKKFGGDMDDDDDAADET
eukprot:CAMPEP_0176342822 /NCGR_PEP_ID=MMETSP0126-20121128/3486_1 /TAXON_ID=141414 ORGANISM="Strombidinopsis acuminatum, Strain SPMC142" /NCGR_SAMPLE_ID=MMETSP0126 /ASSEMBLY_ACC=CAM_ASM_000229 /LENGTH=61 /DNA_ID=CAMNT_0017688471 /DNA_START=1426 /DNA_END=1611 /DNA_ORIENTATION=-